VGGAILDIGEKTAREYATIISDARTILWAGPMGMIEKKEFEKGNLAVAKAIAKNQDALSITGGGETVTFLKKHKLDKKFSFISTGGGAMLEFLAGKKLPGIEALRR
jgi:phosphoglycerate kinase